jgi:hypothetical protein
LSTLRVVSAVHDPIALALTCRHLGLATPVERTLRLGGQLLFGRVVRVTGLKHPVVCDTLTGLIAYHPADNAHDRYARLMLFVRHYYDVAAERRRHQQKVPSNGRPPVVAAESA